MNYLKIKTTWSNYELGVLKICVASFYISIGIYFHQQIEKYLPTFIIVFLISVIAICWIWFKKPKF